MKFDVSVNQTEYVIEAVYRDSRNPKHSDFSFMRTMETLLL